VQEEGVMDVMEQGADGTASQRRVLRRGVARAAFAGIVGWLIASAGLGCRSRPEVPVHEPEPYLLVWAGDADRQHDDFLAVVDVDPASGTYGTVVHTVPVGTRANEPHAMEASLSPDGLLFAGGLLSSRTFVFDVSDPARARLVGVDVADEKRRYAAPRAYLRLLNGHRIGTFGDRRGYRGGVVELLHGSGGLVEFGSAGRFVREIDSADPTAAGMLISPHGIALSAKADRLLTTDAGHGYTPTSVEWTAGISMQIRQVSTGKLLQTVPLAVGQRGDENLEPRTVHFLRDGSVALVSTGEGAALYASWSIATGAPTFALVYDFGAGSLAGQSVVTPNQRYYFQTLTGANRLDVLDVKDAKHPRLVNRIRFDRDPAGEGGAREGGPYGLARAADGRRLAVSNYTVDTPARQRDGDRRIYLVDVDPDHGGVGFDLSFRDEVAGTVGLDFNRTRWPHGDSGPARPAALLFAVPIRLPEAEE
jgi:hypothetical protein